MNNNTNEKHAIYPGSFNPFHDGHLLIVKNASKYFTKLIILVANNPSKNIKVSLEERRDFILKYLEEENLINVEVAILKDFERVSKYAKMNNVNHIVRGILWTSDKEYNFELPPHEHSIINTYSEENPDLTFNFFVSNLLISSTDIKKRILLNQSTNNFIKPKLERDLLSIWTLAKI